MERGVREVLAVDDSPAARELRDMLDAVIEAHPVTPVRVAPAPACAASRAPAAAAVGGPRGR